MSLHRAVTIALACALGACAIHPLPENVTGVKTAGIVHRVRCEARGAMLDAKSNIHPKRLKELQAIGIVYSFTLTMSEMDSLTFDSTFQKLFTNGSKTINPMLGDSLTRQNMRVFTIADTYQSLVQMDENKCKDEPAGPNYQYPIVGRIGIDEMIQTFVSMVLHDPLAPSGEGSSTTIDPNAAGPLTMVDTLTFTTTINASATPTIMLNPATSAARLTSASLMGSVSRTDTHEVIVGLGVAAAPQGGGRHALSAAFNPDNAFPMLVTAASPSHLNTGVAAALNAVNSQIIRFELPKPVVVVQ